MTISDTFCDCFNKLFRFEAEVLRSRVVELASSLTGCCLGLLLLRGEALLLNFTLEDDAMAVAGKRRLWGFDVTLL